ncbi:MAG: hypothetical protein NVSMB25_13560 [Thermoleophilaceae bacterium]
MRERLDVAGVLERVFGFYRARAAVLLTAALIVFLAVALVRAALLHASSSLLILLLANVITLVATFWYQGIVVETVAESRPDAGPPRLRDLFEAVEVHLVALAFAGTAAGVAVAIGLELAVVPGVLLLTLWWVLAPVIVLEGLSITDAFRRSRDLVRGNFLRVLGVVVAVFLIEAAVTALLESVAGGGLALFWVLSAAALILTAPVSALASTITYFDLLRISGAADVSVAAVEGAVDPEGHAAAAELHDEQPVVHAEPTYPADWYPDPHREARLRYWDGTRWTEHTAE